MASSPPADPPVPSPGDPHRAINFDVEHGIYLDDKTSPGLQQGSSTRPKGLEMRRELTKEDRELAEAGYSHLDAPGAKVESKDKSDITEHMLDLDALSSVLDTAFDAKSPNQSHGLTAAQAKERLERYGRNVLTPPKKKSAIMKVRRQLRAIEASSGMLMVMSLVPRMSSVSVQRPPHSRWYPGVYSARH